MNRMAYALSGLFLLTSSQVSAQFSIHTKVPAVQRTADVTPPIQAMVDAVRGDSMISYVTALTSFGHRQEGTPQRDSAADYIVAKLASFGVKAESEWYTYCKVLFSDVAMPSPDSIFLVANSSKLFRSTDGGKSWNTVVINASISTVNGISFVNTLVGYVAGQGGTVCRTTDGGISWTKLSSGTGFYLNDVSFLNESLGLAAGIGGMIVRTSDGGATWSQALTGTTASLNRIQVIDPQTMVVVGSSGTILRSEDGGSTWTRQLSGVTNVLRGVHFLNRLTGWVVGVNKTLLKTSDGGISWTGVALPDVALNPGSATLSDISCVDSVHIDIIDVVGGLYTSTDGGKTWARKDILHRFGNANTTRIARFAGKYLCVSGSSGTLLRSTDAGETWTNCTAALPAEYQLTSRNISVTIPGSATPEKECVMVAHYDSGTCPGADDNASGTSAIMEAARVLKDYQFVSTIRLLAVSGEELWMVGSEEYVRRAKTAGRDIIGAVNGDMIGYPLTGDTTRLVAGSYLVRNPLVDLALLANARYDIGAKIDTFVDSSGASDYGPFALAGYDALEVAEGTPEEIWGGMNPYYHKAGDTVDKLHPGLMRRGAQLMIATIAEMAKPYVPLKQPWDWQTPFERWDDLRGLATLDPLTMVAVGELGSIIKSTDGGNSWSAQMSPTQVALRGVSFSDMNNGMAVGDSGTVLLTTDGGTRWSKQVLDETATFYSVHFVTATTAYVAGYPGVIYRTTDGGNSWISQPSGPAVTYQSIFFTSPDTGFVVGSAGTMFRTTNGGMRWLRVVSGTTNLLDGIAFADAVTGIAVGDYGTIVRTTNCGVTWTPVTSGLTSRLYGVSLLNANFGFAVGEPGLVLGTTDGGLTWTQQVLGSASWLSSVQFLDERTATVAGSEGVILKTTDRGAHWVAKTGGPRVPFYAVRFTSPNAGFAAGYHGTVYRTSDGGSSWKLLNSGVSDDLLGIECPSPGTVIAVGNYGELIRSTDGGESWINQSLRPTVSSIYWLAGVAFANASTGLVVGRFDKQISPQVTVSTSVILRTTDGGVSWAPKTVTTSDKLLAVSFGDENTATAVGEKGLIERSTDGGQTWIQQSSGTASLSHLSAIASIDGMTAVAVGEGGTILRTTNGGAMWSVRPSGTSVSLHGVWFVNSVNGIAVGDKGLMLVTSDGGGTWKKQPPVLTKDLYAVHFSDADHGTIVGDLGTVLRAALSGPATAIPREEEELIPHTYLLNQNYPNPFNASTVISFGIAFPGRVRLSVFDLLGREVAVPLNEYLGTGSYRIHWDGSRLPSGVYFYRLFTRDFVETRRMVLIK